MLQMLFLSPTQLGDKTEKGQGGRGSVVEKGSNWWGIFVLI